jgi:hypothetical protein
MVKVFVSKYGNVEVYGHNEDIQSKMSLGDMKDWIARELADLGGETEFGTLYDRMRGEFGIGETTKFTIALEEMVEEDGDVMSFDGYNELVYLG